MQLSGLRNTLSIQKAVWHLYKKMVPLDAKIKLTCEELDSIRNAFKDGEEHLNGLFGPYRVKAFTIDTFLKNEDARATEEELSYEYEWCDL